METLLTDIQAQGFTWPLLATLLTFVVLFLLLAAVRDYLTDLGKRCVAKLKLRFNEYITEGAWVEIPTSTTPIIAKINKINLSYVVLVTADGSRWIRIPLLKFTSDTVTLITTEPAL